MGELRDWSATAASNNFATSEGGMPEGMDYRQVNNSARERMAAVRRWLDDNGGILVSAGGPTAYTLAPNASTTPIGGSTPADVNGTSYVFEINVTSTGAFTLAVDGGHRAPCLH